MSLKKITPDSVFNEYTDDLFKTLVQRTIKAFTYVGELCVKEARIGGNYQDRTGNLRSSIGYTVLFNGSTYSESGFANTVGGSTGKKIISSLKKSYSKGVVLIVSAGMNYAAYVEARNYNVITSAELLAEKLVPKILSQLGFTKK